MNLSDHITMIDESDADIQRQYMPLLRKKLKWALFRYGKTAAVIENKWLYNRAFPHIMNVYWIGKEQINKMLKRG